MSCIEGLGRVLRETSGGLLESVFIQRGVAYLRQLTYKIIG